MNYSRFRIYFNNVMKWQFLRISIRDVKFYSYNMPISKQELYRLQQHNTRLKERNAKYESGSVYLQIIGTGAKGTGKSVYLFTDHKKYLFNCGEGVQRLAHEHRIRISRLEHVFITYPEWENIGGLTGLALTLKGCGTPELTVHGPYGVDSLFRIVKNFVSLSDFVLKLKPSSKDVIYQDNVVTIQNVLLMKKNCNGNKFNASECDTAVQSENDNETEKFVSRAVSVITVAYICKLAPKPGSLNLEACVERGVPPGPLLGKLKAGQDVTLPNGSVVKSVEVMNPDKPGAVFIVLDCPDIEFIDSLLEEEIFKKYQTGSDNEFDIATMVLHFTSASVMRNTKYTEWMRRFPDTTVHVNINECNRCLGSAAVHEAQYKLNLLDDEIFPLLKDDSLPMVKVPVPIPKSTDDFFSDKYDNIDDELLAPINVGHTLRTYCFRPTLKLTRTGPMLQRCPEQVRQRLMLLEGLESELDILKSKLRDLENKNINQNEYPHVVFFGTGSSIPSKSRNVSAILLCISPTSSMLLDCGEGTYIQMVRFYGNEKVDEILTQLNCVYISHLHADHHMGLIGLIKARRAAFNNLRIPFKKVILFGPSHLGNFLNKFDTLFESIASDFILIPNFKLDYKDPDKTALESIGGLNSLELKEVLTTEVIHCPGSYGVAICHENGWKLTYSGDTMPCVPLINLGMHSDLLIHEATMEDELAEEAKIKMHSTVSEALSVADKMKAKFTILTHFSQRYAKIPRMNHQFTDNIGIAFDNMKVRFSDFSKLPLFFPTLKIMFSDDQDMMEYKALKRKRRSQFLSTSDSS